MVRRTGASTKKRRQTKRKKGFRKKRVWAPLLMVGVVAAGIFGYAVYKSLLLKRPLPWLLVFETYPQQGTETKIVEIDRCIYNALSDLNISPGDVAYRTVKQKMGPKGPWIFSELQICVPETSTVREVKETFLARLSPLVPQKSIRFILRSPRQLTLDLSVNGHLTHHVVFARPGQEMPAPSRHSSLPRVAIIIDDLGYDEKIASKFLTLDGVMSFSVLPHSPFQETIARAVRHSDRDILLHLPMEPEGYPRVDPGPGALLSSMTPDRLSNQLQEDLNAVPFVIGVNNHMGSKLTQDPAKMCQIFTLLKGQNLFFVDSRTSPRSCGSQAARRLKLKFGERAVFLDHDQDPYAIRLQIRRLITIARERGKAIGIGHPHPITWQVLSDELPDMATQVRLVRVSELVG